MANEVEKAKMKKKGKLGKFGLTATALMGGTEYFNSRKEDETVVDSAVSSAGIMAAAYMINPFVMLGGAAAIEAAKLGIDAVKEGDKRARAYSRAGTQSPFASSRFIETRNSFTMRQAGMAAINQARGNLDNAMMGNEAGFMHR